MYDTEVNDNHVGFLENLFDYQQHHQDIYLKVKKPLLYYMKIKFVFLEKRILQHHQSVICIHLYVMLDAKGDLYYRIS